MSGVYPYCLLPAHEAAPSGVRGIGGSPVRAAEAGVFTVWLSDEREAPPMDLEAVADHHRVVEAATGATTPLPVRFGAWAPDFEVLANRIDADRPRLEEVLAAVRGRIELGVRIDSAPGGPSVAAAPGRAESGRAHMRALSRHYAARRRSREEREALDRRIRDHLGPLAARERTTFLDAPGIISVAHLVHRSDVARYHEVVAELEPGLPEELRCTVTGPWAPYSFAAP